MPVHSWHTKAARFSSSIFSNWQRAGSSFGRHSWVLIVVSTSVFLVLKASWDVYPGVASRLTKSNFSEPGSTIAMAANPFTCAHSRMRADAPFSHTRKARVVVSDLCKFFSSSLIRAMPSAFSCEKLHSLPLLHVPMRWCQHAAAPGTAARGFASTIGLRASLMAASCMTSTYASSS